MADLVSKSGTESVVWQYFGLRKGTDGVAVDDGTAVCHSCSKTVYVKHGNTSNLLAHLRIHYSNLHAEVTAIMKVESSEQNLESVKISRHSHKLLKWLNRTKEQERNGRN